MSALSFQLAEILRLRALLRQMTVREVQSRFTGTALGPIWLYAQPLLTIGTYYFVFDLVFKARLADGAPTRSLGLYLVVSMVPWLAFADAVSRAMSSLVEAGSLLQKNALALVLFPARAVAASGVTYVPPILLVAIVVGVIHGSWLALFWLPVLLIAQFFLSFLLGYALAILAAAMRDVTQVLTFLISLGVFVSPVLFSPDMFPDGLRWVLWLNPMTPVILGVQDTLLLGRTPAIEIWAALAVWLALAALLLNRLIRRSSEYLVDWL